MGQILQLLHAAFDAIFSVSRRAIEIASVAFVTATRWSYFWVVVLAAAALLIFVPIHRSYTQWRKGWLSGLIEDSLNEMRRRRLAQGTQELTRNLSPTHIPRWVRHLVFLSIKGAVTYISRDFWVALRAWYLPSLASAAVVVLVLALILFVPNPPQHATVLLHPTLWWSTVSANMASDDSIEKIFEGLIIVVIALIVFVAESIRGSRTSDEKRVLLRISMLWLLALLITAVPFGFLYPPATGLMAALVGFIAVLTAFAFGRVLGNLLSSEASSSAQRAFLRSRIRENIINSARQRVGNRILFDKLGPDKEIRIDSTVSKSWLPGGSAQYVYVDATAAGILSDINLDELGQLAKFLEQKRRELNPVPAPSGSGVTAAAPRMRHGGRNQRDRESNAYLIRRFQEQMPEADSIFARDRSVLAIPRQLAQRPDVIAEARARAGQIFRFSSAAPPSEAFRHEMQSTKDRLIEALRNGAVGEVDDLCQTYLLVAEEFLTTLNELGGGYTAEQARQERSDFFSGWNEVRWLREDLRELMIKAADTDNWEVISKIAYLPFAISARAIQCGDHLLFQEFLSFASLLYSLGQSRPPDSRARSRMIQRSWRAVKELMDFYIQARLTEESADD